MAQLCTLSQLVKQNRFAQIIIRGFVLYNTWANLNYRETCLPCEEYKGLAKCSSGVIGGTPGEVLLLMYPTKYNECNVTTNTLLNDTL